MRGPENVVERLSDLPPTEGMVVWLLLVAGFLAALAIGGFLEEVWRTRCWTRRDWED
jgi:hypothetical protein